MDLSNLYYIAAFITAVVGFYISHSLEIKHRADTANALTEAAMKIVESKDKDIDGLKKERLELRLYVAYLLAGIKTLQKQILQCGGCGAPEFNPKSLDEFEED